MAKAVGIGGVFLRSKDPAALSGWYAEQFGVAKEAGATSVVFEGPESMGMTVFAHFPADTDYFGGAQQCMVNLRVDNLDALLQLLAEAGARIDPKREDHDYGRFAWVWDPEGNRVELWEAAKEGA